MNMKDYKNLFEGNLQKLGLYKVIYLKKFIINFQLQLTATELLLKI